MSRTIRTRPVQHHRILLWHPYELTMALVSLSIMGSLLVAALVHTDRLEHLTSLEAPKAIVIEY